MKKFLCLFLSIVLLFLTQITFGYEYFAEMPSYYGYERPFGDINSDGITNTVDLSQIKLLLAFGSKNFTLSADLNNDCDINTIDLATLKLLLAGLYDFELQTSVVGKFDANKSTFFLSGNLPVGTYLLKYEDAEGVIKRYSEICELEIKEQRENAAYEGFIDVNCAPLDAVTVGVYNSSDERVGEIPLGKLKVSDLGEKIYSFGALSDVHLQRRTAEEDYERALEYYSTVENVDFITVAGDLTALGTKEELAEYKAFVEKFSPQTPIYEITGNHEGQQSLIADYVEEYTGESIYYSFTHGDDVFIMVGDTSATTNIFTDEELIWLYETLEANRDKRCFVFQHVPSLNTSGLACGIYENNNWGGNDAKVFESLMEHYSNVIWFHGHSHLMFELQNLDKKANYDDSQGFHSVHIPSLAVPRTMGSSNNRVESYEDSQGYVVDVYEKAVVLRGRDFISGKFLPIATYVLDTSIKNVDADLYYDSTGTILNSNTNIIGNEDSWYKSSFDKSRITKITFSQNYSVDSYDEVWEAGVFENGQVKAYRNGTELTIVGNSYGIQLNADSDKMFKDFISVTEINGLNSLKTSNLTSFTNVFQNCKALREVDISNFDLSNVRRIDEAFKNCCSLKNVKLMNNIAQNSIYKDVYMLNLFYGCSSLEYVDMSVLPNDKIYYTSCVFYGCESLNEVKFGNYGISNATNMFLNCTSLKEVEPRHGKAFEGLLNRYFK